MNLGELTEKDCELLLDAIDAWERAPMTEGLTDSIVGGLMRRMANEEETSFADSIKRANSESRAAAEKTASRRRIAILLRAKVELIRQGLQAAALKQESEGQP